MPLSFVPYLVLSVVHLVVLAGGDFAAVTATKLLLMPALALAVLLARPPRSATIGLLLTAVGLSWAGDAALTGAGSAWFVIGLLAFLAAHVAYVVLFVRETRGGRRLPAWTAVYVAWYAGFLSLLAPGLGWLFAPVAAYGLVLGAMAALAGRVGGVVAVGGALFVVSDTVLALGRFLPGYEFALHDLVVMSTYLAAQGLIAYGVLRRATAEGGVVRRRDSAADASSEVTASDRRSRAAGRRSGAAAPASAPRRRAPAPPGRATGR